MNDEPLDDQDPVGGDLAALLADPAIWEPLDAATEARIVVAIRDEAGAAEVDVRSAVVVPISQRRRWVAPFAAGAAAVALVVGVLAVVADDAGDDWSLEVALESTELAPAAAGVIGVDTTPLGTRIVLDVSGLPPADDGQYYEAWLRTGPDIGVSAGTFHLRGGDGEIELWAGVTIDEYPLFTITIQDEADPTSSGRVVLRARVG